MKLSFEFLLYEIFFPAEQKKGTDWRYACIPLLLLQKKWAQELTPNELGWLVHAILFSGSNGGPSVDHWNPIVRASGKHSHTIVRACFEKFQQLGILSDLQIHTNKLTNKLTILTNGNAVHHSKDLPNLNTPKTVATPSNRSYEKSGMEKLEDHMNGKSQQRATINDFWLKLVRAA